MYIILGATGHVGSAVANKLLNQGEAVTVLSRDASKANDWRQRGAEFMVVDVTDVAALRQVFSQGRRLFLLNPPAAPSTDTVAEERKSLGAILAALKGSTIEKIVAESTYGAQPGDRLGDLGVLYEMEQQLATQPIPATIIRAAYYMSNWDASLQTARQEGKVYSLYPAEFKLPMVAPHDIGQLAARLLQEPVEKTGVHYVEGPTLYSSAEVATAFATALHKPVELVVTPQEQWVRVLQNMGFSEKAAESLANMTAATLHSPTEDPEKPERGSTTLQEYVEMLVQES